MKSLINNNEEGQNGSSTEQLLASSSIASKTSFAIGWTNGSFQIVLKAAAVAVSHGKKLTLDLMSFIFIDNDLFAGTPPPMSPNVSFREDKSIDNSVDETPHISISDVLLDLLKKGDFIKIH